MMSARSLFSRNPFRGPIQRSSRLVCLALFVVSVGTVGAHAAETVVSGLAEEILELAGSKIGLCVHLGCGRQETAALTAELATASRMLVHGVAVDDASCNRARRAISERKRWGQATAERLPLRPLPHLDNLANLVVIEGFDGLAQQGLTWDEVQRIVAPGGRVCLKKDGRWTATVKARPPEMDDWTHPAHGPDGNRVSQDRVACLPVGLRWLDGIPLNLGETVHAVVKTAAGAVEAFDAADGKLKWSLPSPAQEMVAADGVLFLLLQSDNPPAQQQILAVDLETGRERWRIGPDQLPADPAIHLNCAGAGVLVVARVKAKVITIRSAASGKVLWEINPAGQTPLRQSPIRPGDRRDVRLERKHAVRLRELGRLERQQSAYWPSTLSMTATSSSSTSASLTLCPLKPPSRQHKRNCL